jgi:hypothetical protein
MEDADAVSGNGDKPEPDDAPDAAGKRLWGKRGFRVAASLGAAVLATGIGLGVASAVHGSLRSPESPTRNRYRSSKRQRSDKAAVQESQDGVSATQYQARTRTG